MEKSDVFKIVGAGVFGFVLVFLVFGFIIGFDVREWELVARMCFLVMSCGLSLGLVLNEVDKL